MQETHLPFGNLPLATGQKLSLMGGGVSAQNPCAEVLTPVPQDVTALRHGALKR